MTNGGRRPGSGRPKGSHNKASIERQKAIAASGLTPLDYLLSVCRDLDAPRDVRIDAAKAAAPYVHPRLSSVEHAGAGGGPIKISGIEVVFVKPGQKGD